MLGLKALMTQENISSNKYRSPSSSSSEIRSELWKANRMSWKEKKES